MAPDRWQVVKSVFEASLAVPPAQRGAYLDTACPDAEVRTEVESLLTSSDEAGDFIEPPAAQATAFQRFAAAMGSGGGGSPITPSRQDPVTGRRIGPYRLIKEIGRGGMGSVYRAVRADDEFQRLVAIKLVRVGLDDDFIRRRFRTERQILASLDHPHIARLLDGGTTEDGTPYLVMEYIEGQPLLQYCDRQRLSIADRVELFRQVCAAVSYAHQNLVVHRDIKPSNILITKDGTPKLLDFGIAKILNAGLHRCANPSKRTTEFLLGRGV